MYFKGPETEKLINYLLRANQILVKDKDFNMC